MGFGSEILTDDGVALKIVDDLKLSLNNDLFDFQKVNLISLETLNLLAGFKKICLVDAAKNKNESIGTVKYFQLADFQNSLHLINSHDLSLKHLINLGKLLSYSVTDNIQIITINVQEAEEFGHRFSKSLNFQYLKIYQEILKNMLK